MPVPPHSILRVLVLLDLATNEYIYRYVTQENEESVGAEVVAGPLRLILSIEADAIGLFIDRRGGERRQAG